MYSVRAVRGSVVRRVRSWVCGLAAGIAATSGGQVPWAVEVMGFDPGSTATFGFDDPETSLGEPERFTGEMLGFPSVVSPFSPAFGSDELVSIGEGGHLTVRFARPIVDDPTHRFGVDLIIFGNGGFIDDSFPDGVVGDPAELFGLDRARLELSVDGSDWVDAGEFTEGFAPAMGYQDGGAFDSVPGTIPTDFTRAIDPTLDAQDFAGLGLAQVRDLYDGSGGGTGIDVAGLPGADTGFVFARISVPDDGDSATFLNAEVEALAVVPAPGSAGVLFAGILAMLRRR